MTTVVVRVRTPYGMVRDNFNVNMTLKDVLQNVQEYLKEKKNQIVEDPALFPAPFNSSSSQLPLNKTLNALRIRDGTMLELKGGYKCTKVEIPDSEKSIFELPPIPYEIPACALHSKDQSCVRCMTARYIRVDRQEKSVCTAVAADQKCVAVFKYNLKANLAYSVQRVGILYGLKRDDGTIQVDFIYEPPQENSATDILLLNNQQQQKSADLVASTLGYKKVGCIIGQTVDDCEDEEFIMTAQQLLMIADLRGDAEDFIILCSGSRDGTGFVEAFELTDQFYDLYKRRYFLPPKDEFFLQVKLPLWIEAKEENEAEVEFFIVPVPLKQWRNEFRSDFPVENRRVEQTAGFVKELIQKQPGADLASLMNDFHLLLFLSTYFGESDLVNFVTEVKENQLSEGNQLIIKGIAGLI